MDDRPATNPATPAGSGRPRRYLPWLIGCLMLCACCAITVSCVLILMMGGSIQSFVVTGKSMEPALREGDYWLVNKLDVKPSRFDIIVYRYPRDESRDYISRVIGLPGESVQVRGGTVYVNGKALDEPYVGEPPKYTYGPAVLPADHYFVLGDNRNNSSDSHDWGFVPRQNIVGTVWLKYGSAQPASRPQPSSPARTPRGPTPRSN